MILLDFSLVLHLLTIMGEWSKMFFTSFIHSDIKLVLTRAILEIGQLIL